MTPETLQAVFAGLIIVLLSTAASEVVWWLVEPQTPGLAMTCWLAGILNRIFVSLAGIAICVALLDLSAPPLVISMIVGYVVALTLETRLTLRRLHRLHERQDQPNK